MSSANAVAEAFLGGWQFGGITTVQSGEAVTATMSSDFSNTGSFSYRPDQIGNPYDFSLNTGSQGTDFGCTNPGHQNLDCWFNQTVFVTPSLAPGQQFSHQYGDARIGNLRGPDLVDFDFVLQKNFKLRESQQLEFRAEFFNIFNHTQFLNPDGNITDGTDFGRVKRTRDPRNIQFAVKFAF